MDKQHFTKEVLQAELTLYRVARSILKNDEECADAIQSAILNAFEKKETLNEEKFFKTWLVRILINECYKVLRKKKSVVWLEDYTAGNTGSLSRGIYDEQAADKMQEESEVFMALQELEESYRVPLVLFYCEGYSIKEIAKILEVSVPVIKTRLFRGRKVMKNKLEGEYGYEG